jgi:hypothetical protein
MFEILFNKETVFNMKNKYQHFKRGFSRLNLVALLLLFIKTVAKTAPHAVCNNGWYHGYQGLGIKYTVTDTAYSSDTLVIGGGMLSGCSQFSGDDNFDSCGVVQFFDPATTATTPSWTWIVPSLKMVDGTKLAVVGIKAITSNKDGTMFHGVL